MDKKILYGQTDQHLIDLSKDGFCNLLLHPNARTSLLRMRDALWQQAGIELAVASSFRSFQRQQWIWERKFSGQTAILDQSGNVLDTANLSDDDRMYAILRWSALPGASRHHWGTDLDVFDKAAVPTDYALQLTPAEYSEQGPFAPLAQWLQRNAPKYDFFLPYCTDNGGVSPEPWHISYQPTATHYLKCFNINELAIILKQANILGIDSINQNINEIYQKYITNINQV